MFTPFELIERLLPLIPGPSFCAGSFSSTHSTAPRRHGRMRIVAAVTDPDAVGRILRHLGEHSAPPPIAGPRAPPSQDHAAD